MPSFSTEAVGKASVLLGAGRTRVDDSIDPAAGIVINRKVPDSVEAGETVALFHYNDGSGLKDAEEVFLGGLEIGDREPARRPLIHDIIM